jgi:hypothetical protein
MADHIPGVIPSDPLELARQLVEKLPESTVLVSSDGNVQMLSTLARAVVDMDAEIKASAWQPIETAPRDGTTVLLFGTQLPFDELRRLKIPFVFSGYWDEMDGAWCSDGTTWRGPFYTPTHWQPLPPPPRDDRIASNHLSDRVYDGSKPVTPHVDGSKITDGLRDAVAHARGDDSAAMVTTVPVVDDEFGEPRDKNGVSLATALSVLESLADRDDEENG